MNDRSQFISARYVGEVLILVVVIPLLPLLISQRWDWWEAWVYAGVCIAGFAISRALAARRHPDLLAERARILRQEDAKSWDKLLVPLWGLGIALTLLVAGLDEVLDGSPTFSLWVRILALLIFLAGDVLGSYALIENRFFSGMVRIQTERGHEVVSSGPYRWIRHPGYAGALLAYLATPFFLDSWWACVPTLFLTVVVIVRTGLEDITLQGELTGYRDYARCVRYRLVPGVW